MIYCILDIDKRIKNLDTVEELSLIFSQINHKHDKNYSSINHNHDEEYSSINHNHDDLYSPLNHIHSNLCYILPFQASDSNINLFCDIEPSSAFVLEDLDGDIFTVDNIDEDCVTLQQSGADPNRMYHLIYTTSSSNQQIVYMELNDISANRGDNVLISSSLQDTSNAPIGEGTVTFKIEDASNGEELLSQTVNVNNGEAQITVDTGAYVKNSYNIIARYSGTRNYKTSNATATLTLSVGGIFTNMWIDNPQTDIIHDKSNSVFDMNISIDAQDVNVQSDWNDQEVGSEVWDWDWIAQNYKGVLCLATTKGYNSYCFSDDTPNWDENLVADYDNLIRWADEQEGGGTSFDIGGGTPYVPVDFSYTINNGILSIQIQTDIFDTEYSIFEDVVWLFALQSKEYEDITMTLKSENFEEVVNGG